MDLTLIRLLLMGYNGFTPLKTSEFFNVKCIKIKEIVSVIFSLASNYI